MSCWEKEKRAPQMHLTVSVGEKGRTSLHKSLGMPRKVVSVGSALCLGKRPESEGRLETEHGEFFWIVKWVEPQLCCGPWGLDIPDLALTLT